MYDLEIAVISHEELEAIRLVDFMGLEHEEASQQMGVSRKTKANGSVPKLLKLLPSIMPAFKMYPKYLEENGFTQYL